MSYEWGASLEESFVQSAYGMIDYMAERSSFSIDPTRTISLTVRGRDLDGLLFNFLDEILLTVVSEPFLAIKQIQIDHLQTETDPQITFTCYGEAFDRGKHRIGTEIKAITFSNMQISHTAPFDIYVVVDI